MDKLGWQVLGPVSVFRKFIDDEKLYTEDPYYKYRPNSTKVDWDKTHPLLAGKSGLSVLGLEILGAKGIGIGPKSIEFQNRAFNSYSPKTYTKELVTRYKKDYAGLEVMSTRTPQAQLTKQFKKELKEIQKKIVGYKEKGEAVPQRVYDNLEELKINFKKAREKAKLDPDSELRSLYLPIPFFPSREGLDVSPGEISEMDFDSEEAIKPE
jgi:hypothetical protein